MLMYKEGEPLRDLRSYYSKDGASQSVEVRDACISGLSACAIACFPGAVDVALSGLLLLFI